jgi:hypothetical protein
LKRSLCFDCPLRLLCMLPAWIAHFSHVHVVIETLTHCFGIYRLFDLMSYFASCQKDVATDVRWVAFFKFAFIIFSTVRPGLHVSHVKTICHPWHVPQ